MKDFKKLIATHEYDFLRVHPRLGNQIILLGVGGSYAYGTDNENSDIDIRGITLNAPSDLIGLTEFEQYEDQETDTVIYAFNKMIKLLLECNPNTCEILGLEEEQYLIKTKIGQQLLDHKGLFLSQRAAKSFGGYASAQLRRLQNALSRDAVPQTEKEKHILNSVQNALADFQRRYSNFDKGSIHLYIDQAENPEFDTEIFIDACYQHLPLRDYENMWSVMHNVVRDYDKIGKRNKKKDDNHLNKHAMHLIRLFMMAIDILAKGEINTNRKNDLEVLMKIRNGGFQRPDHTFTTAFYDLVEDYERQLRRAIETSNLPDHPDMEKVAAFVESVNKRVVEGDY